MIIELYSSGESVAIVNGTIMVIYEIGEWRLEWLSRGGTLLNIAERERGSRGTDLERKLRITDCNERKMKIANLWVPANLSMFHASLPASRDAAAFNGQFNVI